MTTLLQLPDELLLAITSHISTDNQPHVLPTLQSLACTCSRFYRVVLPAYYLRLAKSRRCDPLVAATVHGNYHAVKTLIERGWSAENMRSYVLRKKYRRPNALISAIELHHPDIAALVLSHGASPNMRAGKIGRALESACNEGQLEIVRALLLHGADIHWTESIGVGGPALHIAARKGFAEIVGLLLDHGADVGCEAEASGHALRVASAAGNVDCVRVLLDGGADVNQRTATQGRALEAALEGGHEEVARYLFARGAEDQLVEGLDHGWLPGPAFAIVSREEKYRDVLDTMLERMDYGSQLAGNNFVSVTRDGNEELFELFLRKGVNVGKHGPRALGVASTRGHLRFIQRLVDAGVDVNELVPKRGHALFRAVKYGHIDCVRYLIKKGASPNVVDAEPWMQSRGWTRAVFCATSLQHACYYASPRQPERLKWEDMVRMLLEAGADPNVSGGRWFHPLNLAAYNQNTTLVRLLLQHGANPSARGPVYGDNALQAAAVRDDIETVKVLLEYGAKIDGSGALQAACGAKWSWKPNLKMVKLFLDHGADPNDKSEAYAATGYINALSAAPGTVFYSALECARTSRCRDELLIQLLLDHGATDEP